MNWLASLHIDSVASTNEKKNKNKKKTSIRQTVMYFEGFLRDSHQPHETLKIFFFSGIEVFQEFYDVTFLIIFGLFIVTSYHVLVLIASQGVVHMIDNSRVSRQGTSFSCISDRISRNFEP